MAKTIGLIIKDTKKAEDKPAKESKDSKATKSDK